MGLSVGRRGGAKPALPRGRQEGLKESTLATEQHGEAPAGPGPGQATEPPACPENGTQAGFPGSRAPASGRAWELTELQGEWPPSHGTPSVAFPGGAQVIHTFLEEKAQEDDPPGHGRLQSPGNTGRAVPAPRSPEAAHADHSVAVPSVAV